MMSNLGEPTKCPVCGTPVARRDFYGDRGTYYDCSQCGRFGLTRSAEVTLPGLLTDGRKAAVLSYGISRAPQPQGRDTKLFDSSACCWTSVSCRRHSNRPTTSSGGS